MAPHLAVHLRPEGAAKDLAPGDRNGGHSCHFHPLEDIEIDSMMVGLGRDGTLGVAIPNDDVCVGADSDAALLWVHVEDLGCIGTSDR